jgi:hypothetical protein
MRPPAVPVVLVPWPACGWCNQVALMVSPGTEAVWFDGRIVTPAVPDVAVCAGHAAEVGWPWKSETKATRRRRASS